MNEFSSGGMKRLCRKVCVCERERERRRRRPDSRKIKAKFDPEKECTV